MGRLLNFRSQVWQEPSDWVVKFHTDDEDVISEPKMVDRSQISHNVKNGKTYKTIFHSLKGWKPGDLVNVLRVSGTIRIDKNKVDRDFLGPIPQFLPRSMQKLKIDLKL